VDRLDKVHDIIHGLGRIGEILAHIDANLDAAPARFFENPRRAQDIAFDRADLVDLDSERLQQVKLAQELLLGVATSARPVDLN
jgi:hypothetical protein